MTSSDSRGASEVVTSVSLREQVERSLSSRIVAGEVVAGSVLTVPTLATQFGISATPVREAMLNLARRGFLEPIRNKGFRVTEVSMTELAQLTAIRQLLEAPPMRDIELDPEGTDELRALAAEIVASADDGRFQDYLEADNRFHLSLLRLTGNDQLVRIVAELRMQTRLVGLARLAETDALRASSREHEQLITLLLAGDGEGAEALMRQHIGHVVGIWSGVDEAPVTIA